MARKVPTLNIAATSPPSQPRPVRGETSAISAKPSDHSPPVPMPLVNRISASTATLGESAMPAVASEYRTTDQPSARTRP